MQIDVTFAYLFLNKVGKKRLIYINNLLTNSKPTNVSEYKKLDYAFKKI